MGRISFTAELDEAEGPLLLSRERRVSRDSFLRFIKANPDLRTELSAEGEMIVMPPASSVSGEQNSELGYQLRLWAKSDGTGRAYDSSAGFNLPNGATRSPDASWVANSRIAMLSPESRSGFLPLCPDFVIELRSKSDSLRMLRSRMTEYIANGAMLGWLIDPLKRTVHVYRPNCPVEPMENPEEASAEPELPGFVLDVKSVFDLAE